MYFCFPQSVDRQSTSSKLSCYYYLVVNICANQTYACQLDAGILLAAVKERTLVF